MLKAKLKELT